MFARILSQQIYLRMRIYFAKKILQSANKVGLCVPHPQPTLLGSGVSAKLVVDSRMDFVGYKKAPSRGRGG